MGALGLIESVLEVRSLANLVVAEIALAVVDVPKLKVLSDPRVGGVENAVGDVVDRGGCREGEFAAGGSVDELATVVWVHGLVGGREALAGLDLVLHGGRVAGFEVVPVVEADVVGADRVVDAEESYGAIESRDLDTDIVAPDGLRPVRHVIDVDFAAEDTNRRGVLIVGGEPDLASSGQFGTVAAVAEGGGSSGVEEESTRKGEEGEEGLREHLVDRDGDVCECGCCFRVC